jgi:hypothetical protein
MKGYTIAELLVASSAFLLLLTATTSILVEWNRRTREADIELDAVNSASMAIQRIATDYRSAYYVYNYAQIRVVDGASPKVRDNGLKDDGTTVGDAATVNHSTIPLVSQNDPLDVATEDTAVNTSHVPSRVLMGVTSTGSIRTLAMATDQPAGLKNLRYIVYYLGKAIRVLKPGEGSVGTTRDLVERPLYRLEGVVENRDPIGFYSMASKASDVATSGFRVNIPTTGAPTVDLVTGKNTFTGVGGATLASASIQRISNVVVGTDQDATLNPFTLRNPHPYSNAGLYSPYLATVSLRVNRSNRATIRWRDGRPLDLLEVSTQAFAGNLQLPQPKGGS